MDAFCSDIERSDLQRAKINMPSAFVDVLQTHGFTRQDLTGVDQMALPLNLAVMAYASDLKTRRVFYFRHALRIGTHRWAIDLIRGAVAQRLMGTLVVIFRPEPVKRMLLGAQARARTAAVLFQGQRHPFMATVLLGVPGANALGQNPKLDPPQRQRRKTSQSHRGKGRPSSVGVLSNPRHSKR